MISEDYIINIKIKTLNSQLFEFAIPHNIRIDHLKKIIYDTLKIPIHRQRLIFKGKLFQDHQILSHYKVEEGHVIQLIANTQTEVSSVSNQSHFNQSQASRIQQFRSRNNFYQRHRYLQKRMNGFRINQPESLEVLEQNNYTINQLIHCLNKNPDTTEPFYFKQRKYEIGAWIDVRDSMQQWYEAQIIGINGQYILVHYNGWSHRWDEWIQKSSPRVMPFRSNTVQSTYSLYMSPFPQNARPLNKSNNPNFQRSLQELIKQVSVTLDKVNTLLKESQQPSQNIELETINRDQIIQQKISQFDIRKMQHLSIENHEIYRSQKNEEESKSVKNQEEEIIKQLTQTPIKQIHQNISLNDNLSNKCDDNMSNKCQNDDMSNKSYKSKRSEGIVDTSSMRSLKIQDNKPNVFFDLEAKSVRSMKSEINKQNSYTSYLNNPQFQQNILQEQDSQIQQQESYEEPKKFNMKKQLIKEQKLKKENQKIMKASQLAPLLDRMGRMLIDLAPHIALLGNTDQVLNNQNLSIITNEGSLQSRIINYLRSNNTGSQDINEGNVTPQQYCDFQIPIMLTPIEIYALNQIQSDYNVPY